MTQFTAADVDLPAFLDTLKAWVSIESPSSDVARVNAMIARAAADAEAFGLSAERIPGRDGGGEVLVVRSHGPGQGEGTLVLAHLDTVHPAGTLGGALPIRADGDRLYGPGVYDMKAGALMALWALRLLKERGGLNARPVAIVFVPDEEIGTVTSRHVIEAEAGRALASLVVEPARDGGRVVTARKGVGMFDIFVKGRPSHAGARPKDGRSAIREAARLVLKLEALTDHDAGVTVTVGTIRGGTARNVVPAECHLHVDMRVPTPDLAGPTVDAIRGMTAEDPDVTVTVTGGLNRPPYAETPAGRALFEHARALAAPLRRDLARLATRGGSDGNFTSAMGVPTLDGLGADGNGAHTLDEHIFVSSLAPRLALLASLYAAMDRFPRV